MSEAIKAQLAVGVAAGGYFSLVGCCITIWTIPMIICYNIYRGAKNTDPDNCYVNETTYEAFSQPQGFVGEENMANVWRKWFTLMFWLLLCRTAFPCLGGCLAFGAPFTLPVVWCCYIFLGISTAVKVGFFWWGVYLRAYKPGRIAAGKMITECMQM